MKQIKTLLSLLLILSLSLALTACGGESGGGSAAPAADNTKPSISGAADMTVEAGSSIDVLAGLTATDAEDGDLTAMISVEASPALTFQNGKTVPPTAGDYELIYSVTDKGGLTAEAYATLTVTRQTGESEVYEQFDFSVPAKADAHGWETEIGESAEAAAELKQGAIVFEIANPGDGDSAVRLVKRGFAVEKAEYRIRIWAKSTAPTYAHLIARDESVDGWSTFGGVYNARIEEGVAPVELFFTSEVEGSAELMLNLGRITPNPDNPEDTTPDNFTVTIDKIELYKITGVETQIPVYTADFASGEGLTMEFGDGAEAEARFEDGTAVAAISAYPTEGGVWSIKANLGLGEEKIEEGGRYYYHVILRSTDGLDGEALVESATLYHEARAHFNGFSIAPGEETELSGYFMADCNINDPVIRFQIGNPYAGAASNTVTFTSVEFGRLEGDKEVVKTIESFANIGKGTEAKENGACPWETFNGTDEDNERGVGVIWTEDGSLYYRIDNGGSVDWHNKLICPVTLPSDCYFTVEITAKATKPVSCGFFLNPAGGWDPRISEGMDITTEEQTFRFTTTDTFITDMDVELLFQFGSAATAELGEVTVEFSDVTIYRMPLL